MYPLNTAALIVLTAAVVTCTDPQLNTKEHKPRLTGKVDDLTVVVPKKVTRGGKFLSHSLTHEYKRSLYTKKKIGPEDKVHYHVPIEGKVHHVELWPNHELVSSGMVVETRKGGDEVEFRKGTDVSCHYQGMIKGQGNKRSAVSTCDGLTGILHTKRGSYAIEPSPSHERHLKEPHPHFIYQIDNEDEPNCGTKDVARHALAKRALRERDAYDDPSGGVGNLTKSGGAANGHLYLETLLVLDKTLIEFHGAGVVENYALTVVNMACNLYHEDSLQQHVTPVIVRIIRLENDEKDMNVKITANAMTTLDHFCVWQQKMNPGNDKHPNHHDVAMLITRVDICADPSNCGLLGLARMAGACDPSASCALAQDNGLKLGYVVAHELAHTLGMDHDVKNGNEGCEGKLPDGFTTVMNPAISMKTEEWTKCSSEDLRAFLTSGFGKCLLDEPADHAFNYQDMLPGVMYGGDYQCRSLISQQAVECDMGLTCDSLNCEVPGYGCMETHVMPAPGTSCGEKKWCYQRRCLELGERPGALDGGWGAWGEWGPCSRTCGSGVAVSERECNNPLPARLGKFCVGDRKRHRICATKPCEPGSQSFRDAQCAEFNDWLYPEDGRTHTWTAHYMHDENPCTLFCKNERDNVAMLKPKVVDGTSCKRGMRDICIGGACREVPCDMNLESRAVEDVCGICHGDGTECTIQEGTLSFDQDAMGLKKVVDVPQGARNVHVDELEPTHALIVVRGENRQEPYVKGDKLGMFEVPGSVAWLGMLHQRQESLHIPGPITQPLSIFVRPVEPVTLSYSIALNRDNAKRCVGGCYGWEFVAWSLCSAQCGPGSEVAVPRCVERQGGLVEDVYCKSDDKPDEKNRPCFLQPCVPRWMISDWQKDCKDCAPGDASCARTRSVLCMKPVGEGEGESDLVADTLCAGTKPRDFELCPPVAAAGATIAAASHVAVRAPTPPEHAPVGFIVILRETKQEVVCIEPFLSTDQPCEDDTKDDESPAKEKCEKEKAVTEGASRQSTECSEPDDEADEGEDELNDEEDEDEDEDDGEEEDADTNDCDGEAQKIDKPKNSCETKCMKSVRRLKRGCATSTTKPLKTKINRGQTVVDTVDLNEVQITFLPGRDNNTRNSSLPGCVSGEEALQLLGRLQANDRQERQREKQEEHAKRDKRLAVPCLGKPAAVVAADVATAKKQLKLAEDQLEEKIAGKALHKRAVDDDHQISLLDIEIETEHNDDVKRAEEFEDMSLDRREDLSGNLAGCFDSVPLMSDPIFGDQSGGEVGNQAIIASVLEDAEKRNHGEFDPLALVTDKVCDVTAKNAAMVENDRHDADGRVVATASVGRNTGVDALVDPTTMSSQQVAKLQVNTKAYTGSRNEGPQKTQYLRPGGRHESQFSYSPSVPNEYESVLGLEKDYDLNGMAPSVEKQTNQGIKPLDLNVEAPQITKTLTQVDELQGQGACGEPSHFVKTGEIYEGQMRYSQQQRNLKDANFAPINNYNQVQEPLGRGRTQAQYGLPRNDGKRVQLAADLNGAASFERGRQDDEHLGQPTRQYQQLVSRVSLTDAKTMQPNVIGKLFSDVRHSQSGKTYGTQDHQKQNSALGQKRQEQNCGSPPLAIYADKTFLQHPLGENLKKAAASFHPDEIKGSESGAKSETGSRLPSHSDSAKACEMDDVRTNVLCHAILSDLHPQLQKIYPADNKLDWPTDQEWTDVDTDSGISNSLTADDFRPPNVYKFPLPKPATQKTEGKQKLNWPLTSRQPKPQSKANIPASLNPMQQSSKSKYPLDDALKIQEIRSNPQPSNFQDQRYQAIADWPAEEAAEIRSLYRDVKNMYASKPLPQGEQLTAGPGKNTNAAIGPNLDIESRLTPEDKQKLKETLTYKQLKLKAKQGPTNKVPSSLLISQNSPNQNQDPNNLSLQPVREREFKQQRMLQAMKPGDHQELGTEVSEEKFSEKEATHNVQQQPQIQSEVSPKLKQDLKHKTLKPESKGGLKENTHSQKPDSPSKEHAELPLKADTRGEFLKAFRMELTNQPDAGQKGKQHFLDKLHDSGHDPMEIKLKQEADEQVRKDSLDKPPKTDLNQKVGQESLQNKLLQEIDKDLSQESMKNPLKTDGKQEFRQYSMEKPSKTDLKQKDGQELLQNKLLLEVDKNLSQESMKKPLKKDGKQDFRQDSMKKPSKTSAQQKVGQDSMQNQLLKEVDDHLSQESIEKPLKTDGKHDMEQDLMDKDFKKGGKQELIQDSIDNAKRTSGNMEFKQDSKNKELNNGKNQESRQDSTDEELKTDGKQELKQDSNEKGFQSVEQEEPRKESLDQQEKTNYRQELRPGLMKQKSNSKLRELELRQEPLNPDSRPASERNVSPRLDHLNSLAGDLQISAETIKKIEERLSRHNARHRATKEMAKPDEPLREGVLYFGDLTQREVDSIEAMGRLRRDRPEPAPTAVATAEPDIEEQLRVMFDHNAEERYDNEPDGALADVDDDDDEPDGIKTVDKRDSGSDTDRDQQSFGRDQSDTETDELDVIKKDVASRLQCDSVGRREYRDANGRHRKRRYETVGRPVRERHVDKPCSSDVEQLSDLPTNNKIIYLTKECNVNMKRRRKRESNRCKEKPHKVHAHVRKGEKTSDSEDPAQVKLTFVDDNGDHLRSGKVIEKTEVVGKEALKLMDEMQKQARTMAPGEEKGVKRPKALR